MYKFYPSVKQIVERNEDYTLKSQISVFLEDNLVNVFKYLCSFLDGKKAKENNADISFIKDTALGNETYKIEITVKGIEIFYSSYSGAFYAATTLKQIFVQSSDKIKCLSIFDEPDLKVRGFMMDISRNKVPSIKTIKHVIDIMSDVKMNHLELYVEGFSFEYKSFAKYLEDDGYVTIEEYKEIEEYANQRAMDLVPNQNGFGHMAKWLAQDEFKDLAECPEGIFLWGRNREPSTLNPLDPKSFELVKQMYADMLPHTNSDYFNMNFDEPFELGKGKSKDACEKDGIGNVYIDYALKLYDEIKKYNKIPLIWGDVLIHHPELLHRLPKDMVFVDWGYDGVYPFSKNLKKLHDSGIKFIAAPGTTSWCSFAGRTEDWVQNITNACIYTLQYGGEGVLLTDWGDFGHIQFLPISYAPIIFSGFMSWRVKEGTYFTLKDYMNKYIFKDESKLMADCIFDLGNYYRFENYYLTNATPTFFGFMWAYYAEKEENPIEYYKQRVKSHIIGYNQYHLLKKFLNDKIEEIQLTSLNCEDGDLIKRELLQTIFIIKLVLKVMASYNEEINIEKRKRYLEEVIASKDRLIGEQKELWLLRNKSGGLRDTISYLEGFVHFANITLKNLNRRGEENGTQV